MRAWIAGLLLGCCTFAIAREPAAASTTATTEVGVLEGAAYRVDIPANWNHGLVVFFHGYAVDPVTFDKDERLSPIFDAVKSSGYALIQSAYSQTGWAVEQGSADSERLRQWFIAKHGKLTRTFAMGMSMGGTLVVMALETKPEAYDGALSLCGAIEPTDRLMQRDFALRAAFDFYYPGVFGTLVPVDPAYRPDGAMVKKVVIAMRANPQAFASLRALYGAGDARSLPDVIAFITEDIQEMQQRAHGNPFDNADLVYTGSADDDALNDGVHRYRADAKAVAYMARWYTPTGKLTKPLLALHDTRDPLVVASTAFEYALQVRRMGHADNFVQQYVKAEGHCVFRPDEVGAAFNELVSWSRDGVRPQPGLQKSAHKPGAPKK